MGGSWQVEMRWRCSACRNVNLGRFKVCQRCGDPKDDREAFEMPDDVSSSAAVAGDELLRQAREGPDWRCHFCGSHQRRRDGACAHCGASAERGGEVAGADGGAAPRTRPARAAFRAPRIALALSVFCFVAAIGWLFVRHAHGPLPEGPRVTTAKVMALRWEHEIAVERFRSVDHEAFAESIPADALDRRPLGQRFHHNDQVFDHVETESYDETVPDGYRSESYTDRVACGQDCTTRPQTCAPHCTSNRNGFSTCTSVCSGGGQTCTTRYCDRPRTRQVPKTRIERRTRQVNRYRDEPRMAPWFAYRHWEWAPERVARAGGSTAETRWPSDDEVALDKGDGPGERERATRRERYAVKLGFEAQTREFEPNSEADFVRLARAAGVAVKIYDDGRIEVEGAAPAAAPSF